ncbi:MAG: FAD-dependent oxidoreductase, partial [Pseudomonadota bacterium]
TKIRTSRGTIKCRRLALATAGHSSVTAEMAGLTLPIESHVLQAFVTEGLKPYVDHVVTFGAGHFYFSQSDKGGLVLGGDLDGYKSYAQRGNLALVEHVAEAGVAMLPGLSRIRLLRSWGGIMDMTMDGSPIIDKTPLSNLYLNAGWCYGGFKATPASGYCFAHLIATDQLHDKAAAFRLNRFESGSLLDEKGMGPQPNLH